MRLVLLVACACAVAHASPFSIPPRGDPGTNDDATGSFAAAARKDWPCASRKRFEGDEWRVNLRFVYGARKTCRLPIGLADEGITGCVERTVTKSPRDKRNYDLHRMSYAKDGTVERVDSNMGSTSYTWTGDVPSSRDQYTPVRSPGRLSYKAITSSTVDVDAAGRPLRVWNVEQKTGALESRCEYTWANDRLESVQCFDAANKPTWRTEPMYDCKSLGPLAPSVNRNGPLGT
jgi:hypothetical protein